MTLALVVAFLLGVVVGVLLLGLVGVLGMAASSRADAEVEAQRLQLAREALAAHVANNGPRERLS